MASGLQEVAREIASSISGLVSRYEHSWDPCDLDFLFFKLHQLYRIFFSANVADSVLEDLSCCLGVLTSIQEDSITTGYTPQSIMAGKGRPKFDISSEQLEHLLHIGLSCPSIASILGVSLRTVRRRMTEYGLSVQVMYAAISDSGLDTIVDEIKVMFPNCGYRMLDGHLRSSGVRVTQ